jgi:hypothetical protein
VANILALVFITVGIVLLTVTVYALLCMDDNRGYDYGQRGLADDLATRRVP